MGDFLYSIMSDIVLDLRKNRRKSLVFCLLLAIALLMSIMLVNKGSIVPYYRTGVFTGLVTGLRSRLRVFLHVSIAQRFFVVGSGRMYVPRKGFDILAGSIFLPYDCKIRRHYLRVAVYVFFVRDIGDIVHRF